MDLNQLNERIRLYFKKGQKDFDEFDNILLQVSMRVMAVNSNTQIRNEIANFEEIFEVFTRRAQRKEFPTIKYIIYLQFSALLGNDM